jgi:Uma2 family endonuclease
MTAPPKYNKMTVDDFFAWAQTQDGRWELFDGVPVAMAPERVIHVQVKYLAARAFERAIERAGVPCHFLLDGVAVRIDKHRCYQPDVLVYCGQPLPGNVLEVPNPIVVVEVLSPSNAMQDLRDKLVGYFEVPSIVHYLIVDPDDRLVIHHARGSGDAIATRILSVETSLKLDPPGLEMGVAELFPAD